MRIVLLFPLLWVVFVTFAHAEVDFNSAGDPVDAKSTEGVRLFPVASKWYAGGAIGIADISDWGYSQSIVDDYYRSIGYYHTDGYVWNLMSEKKIYVAYRMREYMDLELGFSLSDMTLSDTYENGNDTVWSDRDVTIQALSASALLRPEEGYGHLLYLKFGGHISQLQISKTVRGSPANLNTIAAGDNLPEDGVSTGLGGLIGVGVDIKTGKLGAIRVELNRLFRVGGTSIHKGAINVGFQFNLN